MLLDNPVNLHGSSTSISKTPTFSSLSRKNSLQARISIKKINSPTKDALYKQFFNHLNFVNDSMKILGKEKICKLASQNSEKNENFAPIYNKQAYEKLHNFLSSLLNKRKIEEIHDEKFAKLLMNKKYPEKIKKKINIKNILQKFSPKTPNISISRNLYSSRKNSAISHENSGNLLTQQNKNFIKKRGSVDIIKTEKSRIFSSRKHKDSF